MKIDKWPSLREDVSRQVKKKAPSPRLTNNQTPGRVLLRMLSTNANRHEPKNARDTWKDKLDEMMLALVDTSIPLSQPKVHFVAEPARI
jgi:hypothetical protein